MEHRGSTDLPAPSPTVSRRPESASSPSRGCRQIGGAAFAPPTRSSGCTRNSNAGSRRRPRCHRPTPQPCCSGLCSLPARATCARSMAGKHSTPCSSTSRLTLPPDQIASSRPESRHSEFQPHVGRHRAHSALILSRSRVTPAMGRQGHERRRARASTWRMVYQMTCRFSRPLRFLSAAATLLALSRPAFADGGEYLASQAKIAIAPDRPRGSSGNGDG